MVEDLKSGDHGCMTVTDRAVSKYGDQLTCVTRVIAIISRIIYVLLKTVTVRSKNYRSPAHQEVQTESLLP